MVHLKKILIKQKKKIEWYICRDKKIKYTCRNLFKKLTILEVSVTFYILGPFGLNLLLLKLKTENWKLKTL